VKFILSIILKAMGLAVGVGLLLLGGFMGLENIQAPGSLNIPIAVFSLAAILMGTILLWVVLKNHANT